MARGSFDFANDAASDATQVTVDTPPQGEVGVPAGDVSIGPDVADAASEDAASAIDVGRDVALADLGNSDTPSQETGLVDVGPPDAGVMDVGPADAGPPDTGVVDTGVVDTGVVDVGTVDMGTPDVGTVDTGPVDSGASDVPQTIVCLSLTGMRTCRGENGRAPCCIVTSPTFPPACGLQLPTFGCLPN